MAAMHTNTRTYTQTHTTLSQGTDREVAVAAETQSAAGLIWFSFLPITSMRWSDLSVIVGGASAAQDKEVGFGLRHSEVARKSTSLVFAFFKLNMESLTALKSARRQVTSLVSRG